MFFKNLSLKIIISLLRKSLLLVNLYFFYHHPAFSQQTYAPVYSSIIWENDVFNGTDQYFTNGSNITFLHTAFRHNPLNKLIPGLPQAQHSVFGISLKQDIYTPAAVDSLNYLPEDRPYAGCLMLYMQKTTFRPDKMLRMNSNLGFGFIGNISLGNALQDGIHTLIKNSLYGGWYNQLGNRLLINYNCTVEKALNTSTYNQFLGKLTSEVGNLRTNIGLGYLWRCGILAPYFEPYVYQKGGKKLYYSFFLDTKLNIILYDATLNGAYQDAGLPDYSLHTLVFKTYLGANVVYRNITAMLVQNLLSPEFTTGFAHRYVLLEIGYRF